jgi:uncharacterized repeat protein (TIGR02543 family)
MIIYESNGATSGTVPVDATTYNIGDTAVLKANSGTLFRADYVFVGWNVLADASGTHYNPESSLVMVSADLTLYAEWVLVESVMPDITIEIKQSGKDTSLTLTDVTDEMAFSGYEISRKTRTGDWENWTGSGWGVSPDPVMINRFSDYDMTAGLYQYRARVRVEVIPGSTGFTPWVESTWARITDVQDGKVGWTFGNYTVPDGDWGEVLTAADLRYTYLWGISFTASTGEEFTDEQVRFKIDAAVRELEQALNLTFRKKVVKCHSDAVEGDVYDELEEPYTFHRHLWNGGARLNLRKRPVLSIESAALYTITDQKILDLKDWVRLDHATGVVHFYPKSGPTGTMRVSPSFLSAGYGYMQVRDYAHGYRISYTAGYSDASKITPELRDIVGKIAACKLLNIIGDGLIAGLSSASVSMDGLSESYSSTQSATNAYFGARIGVYLKDIDNFLKDYKRKYRTSIMGSI